MRIMVTGANGFVGNEVVRQLWRDHEVLAVDCLRYGPWRFSAAERLEFELSTIDLRDREAVEDVMRAFQPEAIIHLAAIHFIPECERLPDEAISINEQATANLLFSCPSACRFVFASTAAVYGPQDHRHREDEDPLEPLDVYGFTKLSAEKLVRYYAAQRDIEAVVVRLFNVVGPGETNPHVLPEIIAQLRGGKRRLKLGNVHPKRDYIHVEDAARGFIAAALQPMPENVGAVATANLGGGHGYSVREMVLMLQEVIGEDIIVEIDPARVRKSDRPTLLADNSRMRAYFGWTPEHDLRSALRMTWEEAPQHEPMRVEQAPQPELRV